MVSNRLKGLYGITSQDMLLDNAVLFEHVEQALKGGMAILQYRNKHEPRLQSIDDLIRLKELCHQYKALFIINDNVDLCLKIGADGVHLGKDDEGLALVRERLGLKSVIGVSCYDDLSIAQRAKDNGASYIAFGAFYASPTKPNAAIAPIDLVQQAKQLKLPICCIGGLTLNNTQPLIQAGADMTAVISALFNVKNTQNNARNFCDLF